MVMKVQRANISMAGSPNNLPEYTFYVIVSHWSGSWSAFVDRTKMKVYLQLRQSRAGEVVEEV